MRYQSRSPPGAVGRNPLADRLRQAQVQTQWCAFAGAPNHLQRQVDVPAPNRVWVTDITYIRTYEGWLYLGHGT
jgi:transposase InsO family protein